MRVDRGRQRLARRRGRGPGPRARRSRRRRCPRRSGTCRRRPARCRPRRGAPSAPATSCIVEQFGFAMMPSWSARVVGVDLADHERHAGLHPPGARVVDHGGAVGDGGRGERPRRPTPPAENSAMSTPSNASGTRLDDIVGAAVDRRRSIRPSAPEAIRRSSPTGKPAFAQDLDHRPTDDAGGADDRDGEGSGGHAGHGSTTIFIHSGHGGSIAARRRSPAGAHWSLSSRDGHAVRCVVRRVPWPDDAASRPCATG